MEKTKNIPLLLFLMGAYIILSYMSTRSIICDFLSFNFKELLEIIVLLEQQAKTFYSKNK